MSNNTLDLIDEVAELLGIPPKELRDEVRIIYDGYDTRAITREKLISIGEELVYAPNT
jgi:hypothetical protein